MHCWRLVSTLSGTSPGPHRMSKTAPATDFAAITATVLEAPRKDIAAVVAAALEQRPRDGASTRRSRSKNAGEQRPAELQPPAESGCTESRTQGFA